jgi:hypothetical protein
VPRIRTFAVYSLVYSSLEVMIQAIGGLMKTLALGFALLLAYPVLAKPHEWKTCKIISQNMSSDNNGTAVVPIGGILAAVPIRRYSNTVVMEANGYRMTLVEKQNKHYLVLAENSGAQFYQDGKWFVFVDVEKKGHKFSLVHLDSSEIGGQTERFPALQLLVG